MKKAAAAGRVCFEPAKLFGPRKKSGVSPFRGYEIIISRRNWQYFWPNFNCTRTGLTRGASAFWPGNVPPGAREAEKLCLIFYNIMLGVVRALAFWLFYNHNILRAASPPPLWNYSSLPEHFRSLLTLIIIIKCTAILILRVHAVAVARERLLMRIITITFALALFLSLSLHLAPGLAWPGSLYMFGCECRERNFSWGRCKIYMYVYIRAQRRAKKMLGCRKIDEI
jgi:hypothetical protein